MKRQIALILSLLLLVPGFAACRETKETAETDVKASAQDGSGAEPESDPAGTETEDPYRTALSGLEQADFEDHVFEILVRIVDNPEWVIWRNRDVSAEELTGEAIYDAVYERNSVVADSYR